LAYVKLTGGHRAAWRPTGCRQPPEGMFVSGYGHAERAGEHLVGELGRLCPFLTVTPSADVHPKEVAGEIQSHCHFVLLLRKGVFSDR
jgi:hypothetical protein